jgi:rubrerythrin
MSSAFARLAAACFIPLVLGASAPPLPAASQAALRALLEDERRAEAFYAAVIARHGEVRPFSRIIEAERRHQQALEALFEAHGLPVPPNPWNGTTVPVPASFKGACAAGAQAERDNVALYDRHLKAVSEEDLRCVFERLRWASQERHLPAFLRFTGE